MEKREILHLFAAAVVLFAVVGFGFVLKGNWQELPRVFVFSVALIAVVVLFRKAMASMVDADVEHELWFVSRYGWKAHHHLEKEAPAGIIFPIFFSIFSIGGAIVPTIMTYETKALKRRAAKRFGYYSYIEMTDWHHSLIGAAGIVGALIFATVLYFLKFDLEFYAIVATLYAFFNMVPISKLDGAQIFYGSRIVWFATVLLSSLYIIYATLIATGVI